MGSGEDRTLRECIGLTKICGTRRTVISRNVFRRTILRVLPNVGAAAGDQRVPKKGRGSAEMFTFASGFAPNFIKLDPFKFKVGKTKRH